MAVLLAMASAGCTEPVEPIQTLRWEATLVAPSGEIGGTAAMVATQRRTTVGIALRNGPGGAQLGWVVRTGLCDTEGQRISAASTFPAVILNGNGEGSVETVVNRRIAGSDLYAVEVFSTTDGSGQVLACGEF